jgi:hypothetical protein
VVVVMTVVKPQVCCVWVDCDCCVEEEQLAAE